MRPKRNPEVVWRLEEGMREVAWERARKGEEYEDLGVLTLMVQGAIHQLNLVGAEVPKCACYSPDGHRFRV